VIDIQNVWVPQMLGYCELVADDERLASAFNQKPEQLWTSVTDYGELIEQIFDDLDARRMLTDLAGSDVGEQLKSALETFVRCLSEFDDQKGDAGFDNESPAWVRVRSAAREAVAVFQRSKTTNG
jgi:hypothetical protein